MKLALLALVACSTPPPRVELPATQPAIAKQIGKVDPNGTFATRSEEVSFKVGDRSVPGTLVEPATGIWPAVVMMAGSGPTDRDWNNPLDSTRSGKLLAEALAKRGAVVLRFDKAGVGANQLAADQITFDTYAEEGGAALAFLRTRPEVDPGHLFVAGHSDGGLHAIRVAIGEGGRIAGLILLSVPGRTMKDVLVGQFAAQAATAFAPDVAKAQIASFTQAMNDIVEGRPIDPMAVSPLPSIQQLLATLVAPVQAKIIRDLYGFDPIAALAKINVPVFVFNGLKDVQIDPQLDAARLGTAAKSAEITVFLGPDANRVLLHETRPMTELRAFPAPPDPAKLDPTTLAALANWLARHTTD